MNQVDLYNMDLERNIIQLEKQISILQIKMYGYEESLQLIFICCVMSFICMFVLVVIQYYESYLLKKRYGNILEV